MDRIGVEEMHVGLSWDEGAKGCTPQLDIVRKTKSPLMDHHVLSYSHDIVILKRAGSSKHLWVGQEKRAFRSESMCLLFVFWLQSSHDMIIL